MSFSSTTSLAVTIAHAVSYLTRPLAVRYSSATINKLQTALEANLASVYVATWVPSEPLRGSGRRCLTLSPNCLPPRPVYNACTAARVEWSVWMCLLGGAEFDLFIDPGCISVRFGKWGAGSVSKLITVWSNELEVKAKAKAQQAQLEALVQMQLQLHAQKPCGKTLAQILIEDDEEEEEELFSMIANEVRAPTWMTPLLEQFPGVPEPSSASVHSRSSSRSSVSSSGFSFSSDESLDSCGSFTSLSAFSSATESSAASKAMSSLSGDAAGPYKPSRRERARQARVFVDSSKVEVTPYDGGKTTVLTGGVMLGAAPGSKLTGKKARRD